jgi:hypothetical protein
LNDSGIIHRKLHLLNLFLGGEFDSDLQRLRAIGSRVSFDFCLIRFNERPLPLGTTIPKPRANFITPTSPSDSI